MKNVNAIYVVCGIVLLTACSQSGRRQPNSDNETTKSWGGKTVVKMEKKDGVNQVPVEKNGAKMFFIFDTGAGGIPTNIMTSFIKPLY